MSNASCVGGIINPRSRDFLDEKLNIGSDDSFAPAESVTIQISLKRETFSKKTLACIDRLELRLGDEGDGDLRWKSDAASHPRNWTTSRKVYDTGLILMLDFFTTAISTAGPSVAEVARLEYGLSRLVALLAFGTMYQFGQAFGGVIFPPYSEAFGRKFVYITSSLIYCISSLIVGIPHSVVAVFIGRLISGFVSAVPSIIVSGSIEDMYDVEQRVWLIYAWACATTGGLLIGPVYGSYVAAYIGWRWVFSSAAIATFIFTVLLCFIKESRQSQLLRNRVELLKAQTGLTHFKFTNPDHTPSFATFTKVALRRPIRLFFTEPIVFVISIMSATGWALIYLFTEALPAIYSSSTSSVLTHTQSSLLFLFMLVGLPIGIIPRLSDRRILASHTRTGTPLSPEDKLTGFSVSAPALAFGLWWLGLSVPPASNLPWYATIPGLVPIGFATNEFACTLSGYLADTYTVYASSAFAAMSFLRAVLGGVFPLIGEPMVHGMGANWALVALAGVATLFCASPVLLEQYGVRLRGRSPFARYSLEVGREVGLEERRERTGLKSED